MDEKLEPFTVDFSMEYPEVLTPYIQSAFITSTEQPLVCSTGLDYWTEAHQDGMVLTEQPVCDDPGEIRSNDAHLGAVEPEPRLLILDEETR